MKVIVKYFSLADVYFWGVVLGLDNTFTFGRHIICLGSSYIRVVLHSGNYSNGLYSILNYSVTVLRSIVYP